MSTLFISHSSRDNEAAQTLKARLEKKGHSSIFLDLDPDKGIQAGVSWERTLYTKLRSCRAVVALCSENYLASQWCFAEVALARMEGKQIFVLQIAPWEKQTRLPSILAEEQYIDLRTQPDDGYRRLWNGFEVKGIVPEEHRTWRPGEPPYPGLRAFEESDAPVFFGREQEVREGIELLHRVCRQGYPRVVMVLGASGSGKSSLVRAGLLPELRRDARQWLPVGPFRPGLQPARELASALAAAFEPTGQSFAWEKIYQILEPGDDTASPLNMATVEAAESDEEARQQLLTALKIFGNDLSGADERVAASVHRLTELLLRQADHRSSPRAKKPGRVYHSPLAELATRLRLGRRHLDASVLLVIDQFEELLGHDSDGLDHPANRFLTLLRRATEIDDHPLLVLATMRSDYLGVLQKSIPLEGVGFQSLSVGPMSRDGMRQIIERPAQLGQLELQAGLAQQLLHDTGAPDALPLLAFTLRAMWDRYGADRLLDIREYEELGGLQGAVAQVADETLESALQLGTRADLRNAFLGLARPTEEGPGWVRQPLTWVAVREDIRPMLQCFVDNRLLIKREDDTLEVAHEALFRSWDVLRGWLDTNAEGLRLRREVQNDADKWRNAPTPEEKEPYLWRGGRLARARELSQGGVLSLPAADQAFVAASHAAENAQIKAEAERQRRELRRARQVAAGAVMAGLVMAVLVMVAIGLKKRAETVQESQINALSDYSLSIQKTQPLNALIEAIRAARQTTRQPVEARTRSKVKSVLLSSLRTIKEKNQLSGHQGHVNQVVFSPDGQTIATASADKTVRLWTLQGKQLLATPLAHKAGVNDVHFHPQGDLIATATADDQVVIWKLDKDRDGNLSGKQKKTLRAHEDDVYGVAFSPDGRMLASASVDTTVRLWDTDDFEQITRCGQLDPDHEACMGHDGAAYSVSFSPDNRWLASAGHDKTVKLWNIASENNTGHLQQTLAHGQPVRDVTVSPNGAFLVTAVDEASHAELWAKKGDVYSDPQKLEGHAEAVLRVAVSPDSRLIATASGDDTVKIWRPDGQNLLSLTGHDDAVWGASFQPPNHPTDNDRSRKARAGSSVFPTRILLATASHDESAKLWRFALPEVRVFRDHSASVFAVGANQNGALVTASAQEVILRETTGRRSRTITTDDIRRQAQLIVYDNEIMEIIDVDISQEAVAIVSHIVSEADGTLAATLISLWRNDGRFIRVFSDQSYFESARFSPDGQRLATISMPEHGYRVDVWDLSGNHLSQFEAQEPINSIRFSPDGSVLATGGWDQTIRLMDLSGQEKMRTLDGHKGEIHELRFSPDRQTLASASDDNTIRLWSLKGERRLKIPHRHVVRSISFSNDGAFIATGSDGKMVQLWSRDGQRLQILEGHHGNINGVLFTGKRRLVSISDDKSVRVWTIDPDRLTRIRGLSDLSLNELMQKGCDWASDYLTHNPARRNDAQLCRPEASEGWWASIINVIERRLP